MIWVMDLVRRHRSQIRQAGQAGQATVELSLILPFLGFIALFVGQVGVIAVDAVLVHHAAREAARAAAVQPEVASALVAAQGAAGLEAERVVGELVGGRATGDTLRATVSYRAPTDVPFVGALIGDIELSSSVAIRVE